jgi:hypothetical protein
MLSKFFVSSACAIVLLACVTASPVAAQTVDKEVYFTFSGPVTLPGITLPAGKYMFSIVDAITGDDVVEVQSGDHRHHYGVFLVNRAWMPVIPDKAEVSFYETPKGFPEAIRAYWYPGVQDGFAFVYPKAQARTFVGTHANATLEPVLTIITLDVVQPSAESQPAITEPVN